METSYLQTCDNCGNDGVKEVDGKTITDNKNQDIDLTHYECIVCKYDWYE